MIKSIKIKNIQSHENTQIDFDKGINCIVGSSNHGKSAILRALYWVRYNRPLGIDTLGSHWALNKKGELTSEMSVKLENDSGIVERKRTKTENQYIVNGKELNVVKSDIPAEVEQILKLSDTNIQRQLDEPFLLSETSGEVAKYFNHVVRLDIIDKVLTNAESQRRKTKSDIENVNKIISEQESKLEKYDWLESIEKLFIKFENVQSQNSELNSKVAELENQMSVFMDNNCRVEKYAQISKQKEKLINISNLIEKTSKIKDLSGNLTNSLNDYNELLECVLRLKGVEKSKQLLEEYTKQVHEHSQLSSNTEKLFDEISELKSVKIYPDFSKQKMMIEELLNSSTDSGKIEELETDVVQFKINLKNIENKKIELQELEGKLPNICPLCGNPMKNGVCVK